MSSSITEGSVQGKLLFHIAENGHSFWLECNETTPVEVLMRDIESVAKISFSDQLLLCLDVKLESQRLLSAYKLPSNDREVFIFNRAKLQMNSQPPSPEQVYMPEIVDPPSPASTHEPAHPLDDALDPALKALPSYEKQFRYHYHMGHSIYCRTQLKYENCERLLREMKVQERALEVARGNLDQYHRMIHQNYLEFMRRYMQQYKSHSELLTHFERDLEKLRSTKLHPALQTVTVKTLVDLVKEESLRKSAENCKNSHRQFEKKVSDYRQMFVDKKHKVEEVIACRPSFSIRDIQLAVREHQHFIHEQKSIMQSLSKDVNTVKKLVDDYLSCQLSVSLRPHDAVSALGPMYDVHDKNHLPRMQACDRSISTLLEFCKAKKNEMNIFVHSYMQKISYISFSIKDAKLQFPVFREAIARQEQYFQELKGIRKIGAAYRACFVEVIRRKNEMKIFMGRAGQLAEKLATMRENEVRKREEFLKALGLNVPRDILAAMGLYDMPSQCDVNIAPFDTNLLDVDYSNLDHYAPPYLESVSLKGEKETSMRISSSVSTDSSHSAGIGEFAENAFEKDDCEKLLEGSELIDIAGTSKLEVENAKLKADLASALTRLCFLQPEFEYESLDDSKVDILLKNAVEKTAEALQLKDEYGKHLQSMFKEKQMQCLTYEKRIQELEQRLSDQYLQGQKLSDGKSTSDFILSVKPDECKLEILDTGEAHVPYISTTEPMDEVSCISNCLDTKLGLFARQPSKGRDGADENMLDSSGMINAELDSSMLEPHREELHVNDKDGKDRMVAQSGVSLTNSSTAESMPEPLNALPSDAAASETKISNDLVLELQRAIEEKSNQLSESETKLKVAVEEVGMLTRKLEKNQKLLEESQMNRAHLENCLHEARGEAQTHLCAADRRAAEYNALRDSALKMHSLFERLKNCVFASGGVSGFADSLCALAQSLSNSMKDKEDDGTAEFQKCIGIFAERVGFLFRHREELLDKLPKLEAANERLRKELEEKKEMITTLYKKHQLEKQVNKERLSFNRLEVHEIAAFVLNSAGHYEAINRNYSKYYLSAESIALFTDHLPSQPRYIVGQIVHIERQTVKALPQSSSRPEHGRAEQVDNPTADTGTDRLNLNLASTSNPYNLPIGCEYFVVTVAMLPGTSIHSSLPS